MPIQNYSQDVFFYPWIGINYANGWRLQGDKITCAGNKGDFCVMVVGEEGFCFPKHKKDRSEEEKIIFSDAYANTQAKICADGCAHLLICKHKTIHMIEAQIRNKFNKTKQEKHGQSAENHDTIANFEKAFYQNILKNADSASSIQGDERRMIWDYLSFVNFFQCGVENPQEGKNGHMRNMYKDTSCRAFISILERHIPHIVFIMGKNVQTVIQEYLRLESTNHMVLHRQYHSLFVFIPHQSSSNRRRGTTAKQILQAFQQAQIYKNKGLL